MQQQYKHKVNPRSIPSDVLLRKWNENILLFFQDILWTYLGNFKCYFGKNISFLALGMGPNFGPPQTLKKSLQVINNSKDSKSRIGTGI
jgi:hypothetical protein